MATATTSRRIVYFPSQWRRNEFESGGRGHRSGAKRRKCYFLVVPLHFVALKAQLVVFVSAFLMVNTVWSVSCLLFFYSRCPPCPAICKSGGHVPPCPMESAPLSCPLSLLLPCGLFRILEGGVIPFSPIP